MKHIVSIFFALCGLLNFLVGQTVHTVGPNGTYDVPSAAIPFVADGDIVEIEAGEYLGDVGTWTQNDITLRGVGEGYAHLRADGQNAGGKAYLVGNLLQQGENAPNWHLFHYGFETNIGGGRDENELWFYNNSVVNERGNGVFLTVKESVNPTVQIFNNIFAGAENTTLYQDSTGELFCKERSTVNRSCNCTARIFRVEVVIFIVWRMRKTSERDVLFWNRPVLAKKNDRWFNENNRSSDTDVNNAGFNVDLGKHLADVCTPKLQKPAFRVDVFN